MLHLEQRFFRFLVSTILVSSLAIAGCGVRARIYDIDHNDYHRWDKHEAVYYNQWVGETHRENRDFRRLRPDEQRQYWTWRHSHP